MGTDVARKGICAPICGVNLKEYFLWECEGILKLEQKVENQTKTSTPYYAETWRAIEHVSTLNTQTKVGSTACITTREKDHLRAHECTIGLGANLPF